MPSPFPGMNPYIERPDVWKDFHTRFMALAAERIAAQVLPRYFVKIDEHVYIHELSAAERRPFGRPDLSVYPGEPDHASPPVAVLPAPAEVFMPPAVDEVRQRYLEIRDRQSKQEVTILELLSPSNKNPGEGRDQYWAKTRLLLTTTLTGLVEIDLLRGGPRLPWGNLPSCDYYALVSRAADRRQESPRASVWPIRLRDPLPTVPIPLRPGETEPLLDLQAIVHQIHDAAGYRLFIYDTPPEPPLAPADAVWAAQLLQPADRPQQP